MTPEFYAIIATGIGGGQGDWRLLLESELSLDVFAYARSQDGVVSTAHNVACPSNPRAWNTIAPSAASARPAPNRCANPSTGRAWSSGGTTSPGSDR